MLNPSFARFSASSPALSGRSACRAGTDDSRYRPLLYVLAICGLAPAGAFAQHVHGVIELGVVVEGEMVAVSLNAPLSDVVGFEYAPQTEEQVELVQRAAAMLADPDAMFGLSSSANCASSGISVDGPGYLSEDARIEDSEDADHDHHDHHDDDSDHHDSDHHGHGDDHGDEHHHEGDSDHHDHEDSADHDHDHDHEEDHAEVTANYEWTCDSPSNLDALELRFIDGFAGVEKIEVQILTPAGARVITAGRDTGSVSLATE